MLDLRRYLTRIGFTGDAPPTIATLRALVLQHTRSIPFENIDAFIGRPVRLDVASVAAKLIDAGRGGWCFEQNLLLGEALRALGFEVSDVAGRVLWGRGIEAVTPRTHRALRVRIGEKRYLVDVGFGGQMLTGVLDLSRLNEPQATPHEPFRLVPLGPKEFRVESQVRGEWLPLFRFDTQPQWPVDFEAANFQLVHDPASHFTQGLIVTRAIPEGRLVLRGSELACHALRGETRREELGSAGRVMDTMREQFGITLDAETAKALQRRLEIHR